MGIPAGLGGSSGEKHHASLLNNKHNWIIVYFDDPAYLHIISYNYSHESNLPGSRPSSSGEWRKTFWPTSSRAAAFLKSWKTWRCRCCYGQPGGKDIICKCLEEWTPSYHWSPTYWPFQMGRPWETYCVRAPQCSETPISAKPLAAHEKNKPFTTTSRGRHFRAAIDHEPNVEKDQSINNWHEWKDFCKWSMGSSCCSYKWVDCPFSIMLHWTLHMNFGVIPI